VYDRKGMWGKNMKKGKRKRRKEEKKRKKKNEEKFCVGVTNLIMSVGKYNKIIFSPLHLCLIAYIFPPFTSVKNGA
jgi:hypothetical protein